MPVMKPLDPDYPIHQQLDIAASPAILINLFLVSPEDEEQFLKAWADDAEFMKRQPGFISTQLHRGLGPQPTYINHAVWDSTADFKAAFSNPEFVAKLKDYPESAVASPHLFRKVAVKGICTE